jgi:hypothetical protein
MIRYYKPSFPIQGAAVFFINQSPRVQDQVNTGKGYFVTGVKQQVKSVFGLYAELI